MMQIVLRDFKMKIEMKFGRRFCRCEEGYSFKGNPTCNACSGEAYCVWLNLFLLNAVSGDVLNARVLDPRRCVKKETVPDVATALTTKMISVLRWAAV